MRDIRLDNITEVVVASFGRQPDARQRLLVQQLVVHLHAYAKAVKLTHAEWRAALAFMHKVGDISDDSRSEFSLLSDVTGLSSLVDLLASDAAAPNATPGSVLGPFHTAGSPWLPNPADLVGANAGTVVRLRGNVRSADGQALPDATLDLWQNAANGLYWQLDPAQPRDNLRCQLKVDAAGRFEVRTIRVVPYEIPTDGPVWHELVQPAGRSPWRPAHWHLIVQAPGHRTLVTELFDADDPHLDNDAVFGVREALVGRCEDDGNGLVMDLDIQLAPLAAAAKDKDSAP
jgi:protocatechuate 3,4-dioxygenase beta subunit